MTIRTRRRGVLALFSAAILPGCAVKNPVKTASVQTPAVQTTAAQTPAPAATEAAMPKVNLPAPPEKSSASSPAEGKLDTALLSLSQAVKAGTADRKMKDLSSQLDFKDGKVKVEIVVLRTASLDSFKRQLAGAKFEITAELENHLWGYLPVTSIEEVSKMDQVWTLSAATPSVSAR
jgi:hypothetical protein